jgi:hemerythrin
MGQHQQNALYRALQHEDFNSGNAVIDDQNKKLFKTSSRLLSVISGDKAKNECFTLIENLLEETQQHLHDEKNLLRLHNYPAADEHWLIHLG